jgi:pyrimidine-nucleoside phosphorylase
MSKKLSEGIQGLVLDVKVGSGAFMNDLESARALAKSMVDTGNSFGVKTVAAITDMTEPLGLAIGNSVEVLEAIDTLKGNGPEDLVEVTLYLGALMLQIAGIETDLESGRERLYRLIESGAALKKFAEMVQQQGGNPDIIERSSLLPLSCLSEEVVSQEDGYIQSMDTEAIGTASMMLGAGREKMDSTIDYSAGILLRKKVGDPVKKGDVLCSLCTSDEEMIKKTEKLFLQALSYGKTPPEKRKMILEVLA